MSKPSLDKNRSQVAAPKLIFESGSPGRSAVEWPAEVGDIGALVPASLLRDDIPGFPELGEQK